MAHYRGKDTTVEFASVDISGDSRTVSYEQTADTLDDTVRGLDNRTKIASLQDGSFSYEALDTTGAWSTEWQAIAVGSVGSFVINPEGAGTGNRTVSFTAVITSRSVEFPYDDLAKVSMSGEISGPVTEDVLA